MKDQIDTKKLREQLNSRFSVPGGRYTKEEVIALLDEIEKLRALMAERIRVAWHAGFHSSGEGWNGEYPFGHPGRPDDEDKEMLENSYQEFLKAKGWGG